MLAIKNYNNWQEQILESPSEYEGKFVVFGEKEIFFTHDNALVAANWRNEHQEVIGTPLSLFLVPHHFGSVRLRMLKIRSLSAGTWNPTCPVKFILDDQSEEELTMLVDSGADITYIPKNVGELLGLTRAKHESTYKAFGVGSEVSYLLREMPIKIGEHILTIRFLWGQDEGISDLLLGRLDIFDKFDVLFSQRRNKIEFILNETV
jgi:predicted aspartyl protease